MKFRTALSLGESRLQLDYGDGVLALGSCFAERMGGRLAEAKFGVEVNPLGIVYNPVSLWKHLRWMLVGHQFGEEEIRLEREYWHTFDVHSQYSDTSREALLERLEERLKVGSEQLRRSRMLILTFGTSIAYRRSDTGEIVANCHKYPKSFFSKEYLGLKGMIQLWESLLEKVFVRYPKLEVLLTVSPIRHVKDGIVENSRSKAALLLLSHHLAERFSGVHYFPSYEFMVDDLRDYRFYQEDLVHPTGFAESYIWEQFVGSHITARSRALLERWEKLKRELGHRPLKPNSMAYYRFLQKLEQKLVGIAGELDCGEELADVRGRLAGFSG